MPPVDVPAKTPLIIRPAVPADAAVIAEFNCRLAQETEDKLLDAATVLRGVQLGIERQEICRYFVALADDVIVGQAMITYEWSDWRAGMFWWFQSVYVRAEYRQQGIFRRIFQHIHDLARATPGTCGLRLYVEDHNHRACAAYARLGLQPGGYAVYEQDWSK